MKRTLFIATVFVLFSAGVSAQRTGFKTNTLLLGTASPNAGVEFSMGKKWSFNLEGSYNPITFTPEMFWKHWVVQPEVRWWYCHRYAGSFWGIHALGGEYNISGPDLGVNYRYEGSLVGGGISYGYSWILGKHWNLEAVIGAGYAKLRYDKFECGECGEKIGSFKRDYFGPTRAALSLIYYIR